MSSKGMWMYKIVIGKHMIFCVFEEMLITWKNTFCILL